MTAQEASALTGVKFGAGKESSTSGNAKICTYGYQTQNVFMVEVAVAPDAATAKAEETAAMAELQAKAGAVASKGVAITQLSNFAPGTDAVLASGKIAIGTGSIGVGAIYVLRGATFFTFSDLAVTGQAPGPDAIKAQALTTLGRLP